MSGERHGGHAVVDALLAHGVDHLFTLAGAHLAPVYDAGVEAGIRIVGFRHQQASVHAADGFARVTGRLGVAAVTAGPGVANAVSAVATADRAGSPVLLIGGRSPLAEQGMGAFGELDQASLMNEVASRANTCTEVGRIAGNVYDALRDAATPPSGVSFVDIPVDVLAASAPEGWGPPKLDPTPPRAADPELVAAAVALLRSAQRPVVLAGSGVRWAEAGDDLRDLADALKAPVVLTGLARGALPPAHPSFVSAARKLALREADVIFAVGVEWDYRLGFGRSLFSDGARVVQVHVDPNELGRNLAVELGIAGNPAAVLRAMLEEGLRSSDPAWLERVRGQEVRITETARDGMESGASPIHPQRLAREVRDFLDEDAVVIGDGGDVVGITGSIVHPHRMGHWLDPGPFGCLGVGVPFAMAARLAKPASRVVVVSGDGSFGFSAMEYESAVRQGLPFVGIIGNDGAWGQVRVANEAGFGERAAVAASLSQETGYERMVEALGGYGERVADPKEIRPALERAFDSGVPACINVMLDPALMNRGSYVA